MKPRFYSRIQVVEITTEEDEEVVTKPVMTGPGKDVLNGMAVEGGCEEMAEEGRS